MLRSLPRCEWQISWRFATGLAREAHHLRPMQRDERLIYLRCGDLKIGSLRNSTSPHFPTTQPTRGKAVRNRLDIPAPPIQPVRYRCGNKNKSTTAMPSKQNETTQRHLSHRQMDGSSSRNPISSCRSNIPPRASESGYSHCTVVLDCSVLLQRISVICGAEPGDCCLGRRFKFAGLGL